MSGDPRDGTVFGTGCHVYNGDFEKVRDRLRRIFRDPYYFCVAITMVYAVAGENQIVGSDKIDFILDKSKSAERMQRLFYSDLKPRFPRLGECLVSDDKEVLPLQMADLGVGITRQLYEVDFRRVPGSYALNGLFSSPLSIGPKGLEDIVTSTLFRA